MKAARTNDDTSFPTTGSSSLTPSSNPSSASKKKRKNTEETDVALSKMVSPLKRAKKITGKTPPAAGKANETWYVFMRAEELGGDFDFGNEDLTITDEIIFSLLGDTLKLKAQDARLTR